MNTPPDWNTKLYIGIYSITNGIIFMDALRQYDRLPLSPLHGHYLKVIAHLATILYTV